MLAILAGCSAGTSPSASVLSPAASPSIGESSPPTGATPSVDASASADATPLPSIPYLTPYLPPMSRARVVSATVNVREEPSLDARVLATLTAGDEVHVWGSFDAWGPVASSGIVWYPVETDDVHGWAAKGAGSGVFYLEPIPEECPAPRDLPTLLATSAWERVSCLGSDEITLTGVAEIACQGGTRRQTYEPAWLADWCIDFVLTDRATAAGPVSGHLGLAFPPDLSLPAELGNGSQVNLAGHFDDPAAAACNIEPRTRYQSSDSSLWVLCREQFVVTDIKVVGDIGLPAGA